MASAVDEHDIVDGPARACFRFDLGQQLWGDGGMGFVDEGLGLFVAGKFANGPQKEADGAAVVVANRLGEGVIIDGFGLKADHQISLSWATHSTISRRQMATLAATDGGEDGDFCIIGYRLIIA